MRYIHFLKLISVIFLMTGLQGTVFCNQYFTGDQTANKDTLPENQFLYNGRVWKNRYFNVKGDPYLFSSVMMNGSVVFNGISYENLKLLYDIYNDEILSLTNHNIIIQMNKEMVDGFTVWFTDDRPYRFEKIEGNKQDIPHGYVNILYSGKVSLWVKYSKSIYPRAVENKYDSFVEALKIYLHRDSISSQVRNRRQLLNLCDDRRQEKALADASMSEYHRCIEYKAEWATIPVAKADQFYPSSKTCSGCGSLHPGLMLSDRIFCCPHCGLQIDRDLNAAINLRNLAVGRVSPDPKACGEAGSGSQPALRVKLASVKQEPNTIPSTGTDG